jgi:hypothetical protein
MYALHTRCFERQKTTIIALYLTSYTQFIIYPIKKEKDLKNKRKGEEEEKENQDRERRNLYAKSDISFMHLVDFNRIKNT